MELIDDAELLKLVEQRASEESIKVSIDDL